MHRKKTLSRIVVIASIVLVLGTASAFALPLIAERKATDDGLDQTVYTQYEGVDIEAAPLELVEEIAFLNMNDVPESLRASVLYARDVFYRRVDWFAEHDILKILGYTDELYTAEFLEELATEGTADGTHIKIGNDGSGFYAVWLNGINLEVTHLYKTGRIYPPWEMYDNTKP